MSAGNFIPFDHFMNRIARQELDLIGATLKVALLSAYTPDPTDRVFADVSAQEIGDADYAQQTLANSVLKNFYSVRDAKVQWVLSGSGTNEYYLEVAGGGEPGICSKPFGVDENGTQMTEGTLGSLAAGEWGWGDNDALGYGSTLYVRLTDGTDPDSKALDFLKVGGWTFDCDDISFGTTVTITAGQLIVFANNFEVNVRDAVTGKFSWVLSGSGTSEYYLQYQAGDPDIPQPVDVEENNSSMTPGTAGTLAAGEWDYADNDALGYSTIYVRLSDSTDPDTKADAFVTALWDWLCWYLDLDTAGGDVSSTSSNFDIAIDAAGLYRVQA